jgi:hypothetical protein
MIETLLGGLLGGVTRMAPEFLKFFDRKAERIHELALLAANLESDKAKASGALAAANAQVESAQFTSSLAALGEAVKAQATLTGNKIVDGINSLVRPTVTYILFGMWTAVKLVTLVHLIQTNPGWSGLSAALPVWWGTADQAMLSAVLNFWFLGRVFDKTLKSN